MKTQEEQFIRTEAKALELAPSDELRENEQSFLKVTGIVHDPFEEFTRHDPFTSLEIFDTAIAVDNDNQAFSQKIIQYSAKNYHSHLERR